MEVNEAIVTTAMFKIMNMADSNIKNNTAINRIIRNTFGCTADVVAVVWNLLVKQCNLTKATKLYHLLWMLSYMKSYGEYEYYAVMYKCSEKSFREWVWLLAKLVANLHVVSKNILLLTKINFRY
jgi:hypothetical protein